MARLGVIEQLDGGRTLYGACEAIHPCRLTGPASQQPGAVIGAETLFGDALAGARMRAAKPGQPTLSACPHAHGFTASKLHETVRRLGRASRTPQANTSG